MPNLFELAKPAFIPALDPDFRPAALANRAYLDLVNESGQAAPLVIALERDKGAITRYETVCFPEAHPQSGLNLDYAERLVKFLLWGRGGWRVIVGGPKHVGEHIKAVYSANGARKFDFDFMGGVYAKEFTVETTSPENVPQACESTISLGGHLDGCRIGFDLGASDRKVSAVVDGEAVYTEEVVWDPRNATDPQYHFDELMAAFASAAKHMPRIDAIGGSAAGVYIDNRPRVASLYRGIPKELFDTKTVNLFFDLQKAMGGVPFEVVNDGEVTALAGAMSLEDKPVLGLAFGSSEAAGYVTPKGEITSWLNELAFAPVDFHPNAAACEWSCDTGVGALYFSQQAVFKLAPKAGIDIDPALGLAEKLKSVQKHLEDGHAGARQIWEAIGIYLGYTLAHYADFYEMKHVLILGRVTSGIGGEIILAKAKEVLAKEFPALANISVTLPDEKSRRVGQAVAAASLPAIKK
jgi:predicted NBD/HSP70 family sugar kinase